MLRLALAILAVAASAAPAIHANGVESDVDIELKLVGNTNIKAFVTNNGKTSLKVLKTGSFLSESPVEKVQVSAAGKKIDFNGLRVQIHAEYLTEDSFEIINAGQTVETEFDIAGQYDLSTGGKFSIQADGFLTTGDAKGNLGAAVPFKSNIIEASIDGAQAANSRSKIFTKRFNVQSDCNSSQRAALTKAITDCYSLSYYGRQEALTGSAQRMYNYFKASDSQTRQTVADVLGRVGDQCRYTNSGIAQYCTDRDNFCNPGIVAYTAGDHMVYCPIYFSGQSPLTKSCHVGDQASVIVHESTHLSQVKGTADVAYGYNAIQNLTTAQNLNNADSYTYFAKDIWADCPNQAQRYMVNICTDSQFQGRCFGVQGNLGSCANIPTEFNDATSSLQGSNLAACTGYQDADCKGPSFSIGQNQQLSTVPTNLNDQLTSFFC